MLKTKERLLHDKTQRPCKHYWIIEPPTLKTSIGKCKYCGTTKEFANSFSEIISPRETYRAFASKTYHSNEEDKNETSNKVVALARLGKKKEDVKRAQEIEKRFKK